MFSLFKFKTKTTNSSNLAKERLQIILAHERSATSDTKSAPWMADLQKELLAVLAKYVKINAETLNINVTHQDSCDLVEINVAIPGE